LLNAEKLVGGHVRKSITSSFFNRITFYLAVRCTGWSKKWHKVYGTIILQPYITESCSFGKMF